MKFRVVFATNQRHFHRIEQVSGIGGSQAWALFEIAQSPGINLGELALAMGVHQSTASNLIERIEQLGLVIKRKASSDRRQIQLHATAKGMKLLKRVPAPATGVLIEALTKLKPTQLAGLSTSLELLIGQMSAKDSKAATKPLADL